MGVVEYIADWILPFLIVLSVLVFVHELGHYLAARAFGVRVEVFSIGFGSELFGWTDRAGTRWKFSLIPLGGYVKMFGEMDFAEEQDRPTLTAEEQKVSFHHKRLAQKAWIVAAGPLANFVLALLLLFGVFALVGAPAPLAFVGGIQPGSAAERADFAVGDKIVSINDAPVLWFEDVRQIVMAQPGVPLRFVVQRGEERLPLTATPEAVTEPADGAAGRRIGLLGIRPDAAQVQYQRMALGESVVAAFDRSVALAGRIAVTVGEMATGGKGAEELGGPLRIAQVSGQMAQDGLVSLVFFMAALSINLGLINLLPIPMLDGGHLAFYAIEAVRGRPLNRRTLEYFFRFGLVFVLMLMILATWNDLVNMQILEFFKKLIG
jgi:regulator of sigma E protease